jgi:hypothetical protein
MKLLRKSRLNRYYDLYTNKNTSFDRQIERLQHDPIRLCDGSNENVGIRPIKAVKPGW